jgi:hypothetical protein
MMTAMQPEPTAGGVSVLRKLLAVMKDCGYIQKDKKNAFHNYSYASEAAIKDRVHAALVEHGVIPQISLLGLTEREIPKQGKASDWLTTANVHYKFYCCDTGEFIEGTFYGCGIDPSDKGLYKAITGAIKYLLTSQFLIPTGDDPEGDEGRTASKEEKQGKQQEYLRSKGIGIDAKTADSRSGVSGTDGREVRATSESVRPIVKSPSNTHDVRTGQYRNTPEEEAAAKARVEAHHAMIVQAAKMLDDPPQIREAIPREDMPTLRETARSIEMRQSAKDKEAQAILDEAQRDQQAKMGRSGAHGCIPLDKLKNWKKLKDEIRSYTGTDEIYKSTLKAKGYEHANEIQTQKEATSIWTVLGNERNRLKQEKELMGTLEHANEVLGARVFSDLLGAYGAERITDVFALGGDPLAELLKALKDCVDAKNGGAA